VLGKWGYDKPVWHCSMRAAPEDRLLSDREWAQIAEDVMHRTGLCPATAQNGEPVWYGGGKLAADLSWPKLAQRWTRPARPDPPLSAAEADALWDYAARTTADATDRIPFYTATGDPADAASAASDALHVAAAALGSRALRQAAGPARHGRPADRPESRGKVVLDPKEMLWRKIP
jgi:hypothetical protein